MKGPFQVVLSLSLLLGGCAHMGPSAGIDRSPLRPTAVQQEILFSPAMLKNEYCFPEDSARQIFRWGSFGHEWTWRIQDPATQYAGFYIRKPFDISDVVSDTVLYFKLKPASAARDLSVVLIEGGDRARVQDGPSLAAYQTDIDHEGWASFKINLGDFLPVLDTLFAQSGGFDWDDVQQIRFVRNTAQLSHDQIQIRNMRLRPATMAALNAR